MTLRHKHIKIGEVKQKYGTKIRRRDFFGAARRARVNPARNATEIRHTTGDFCICNIPESDR